MSQKFATFFYRASGPFFLKKWFKKVCFFAMFLSLYPTVRSKKNTTLCNRDISKTIHQNHLKLSEMLKQGCNFFFTKFLAEISASCRNFCQNVIFSILKIGFFFAIWHRNLQYLIGIISNLSGFFDMESKHHVDSFW